MSSRPRIVRAWVALLFALLGACSRVRPVDADAGAAGLMLNLTRTRRVEVHVEEPAALEACRRIVARHAGSELLELSVVESGGKSNARAARVVLGTRASPSARALLERLGAVSEDARAAFHYAGRIYEDRTDVLVATFQDPARPGLPVSLFYGNDLTALIAQVGELEPGWRPWVRVFRAGDAVVSGPLALDGGERRDALELGLARQKRRAMLAPLGVAGGGWVGGFDLRMPLSVRARALAAISAAREHVRDWAKPEASVPDVRVWLWAELADYGVCGERNLLARANPVLPSVDMLCLDACDDGGAAVAAVSARTLLGEPREPWMLDAAALDGAWSWYGQDLDLWLARLVLAERVLGVREIVDPRASKRVSQHVLLPLRGALWRCLRELRGADFTRELWTGALGTDAMLDAPLQRWIAKRAAPHLAQLRELHAAHRAEASGGGFWKGVGFETPHAPQPDSAWETRLAGLKSKHVDALALESTCVGDPGLPERAGPGARTWLCAREGDLELVTRFLTAARSGWRTALWPHLLSGPATGLAGGWVRTNEQDWQLFFDRYSAFVEHHAWLAETCGVDLLSIGSGIPEVVVPGDGPRVDPAEAAIKRTGWERVIRSGRAAFSGALTYSASASFDVCNVPFWSDLDYVGLAVFPSADYVDPFLFTDPERNKTARDKVSEQMAGELYFAAGVARDVERPLLLTHVGFPMRPYGWNEIAPQAAQFQLFREWVTLAPFRENLAGVFAWRVPLTPPNATFDNDVWIHDEATWRVIAGYFGAR
jgi:hypothetical protein